VSSRKKRYRKNPTPTQEQINQAVAIVEAKIVDCKKRLDDALSQDSAKNIKVRGEHRKTLRKLEQRLEEVRGGGGVFRLIPAPQREPESRTS